MKKLTAFILCFLFLFSFTLTASAEYEKETVYATENVNIRTEPNTDCDIITVLQKGSRITRIGEADGWSKVIYEGEEGYIKSEYLAPETAEEKPAEETSEEPTTEDNSTPRFMVTSYELSEKSLTPEKTAILKVTFKNYSTAKAVFNIKLSLTDQSGDILSVGMPTKYVNSVYAGSSYTWEIELKAINTASIGQHDLQVTAEYEDKNFSSYSSSDTVRVDVKQTVKLSYSGAVLPKKVIQGDTQTVTVDLMNTGKSTIYNCTLDFDIEGMQSGGSVFVGNIESAQSTQGSANLRIDTDILGEVTGKITITYEDDYGKEYKKTVDVSTVIEEKVEQLATTTEDEKEKKNPLWWLFILIGLAVGGGIGFGVPWLINDKKQRKEDDLRL
ncbi:MAG: SH3 domain-containing protein [Clostridia bacterium]|nr:SH3 domain-containing protein [Clostridia bacterium]